MKIKVLNKHIFKDIGGYIPEEESSEAADMQIQNQFLQNTKKLTVGEGETSIKIGKEGLWSGARNFLIAPFRMDINGNQTWRDDTHDRMYIGRVK